MQKFRIALCCWLIVLCVQGLAQTQTSNFSTNDEGWTVFDQNSGSTVAPTYTAAGGNPGGFVKYTAGSANNNIYFAAPAKFKGNFSFAYNQTLTFDLQQSVPGTDNTQPDIILRDAANAFLLIYQFPTKPAVGSWTSYSISLNESNWHLGSIAGAAPTRDQFKQVLANIGTLLIRLKYQSVSASAIIGSLDNVVLNTVTLNNPPKVTSFSPASGVPGTTVTITGNNFNTTPAQNKVFFGAVAASVTSATASQLVVTLPPGATYAPVTVVNLTTGLQGSSTLSFNPLFNNNNDNGGRIMPASFTRGYQTILQSGTESTNSFGIMDKGDFDGDGKIDLITTETGAAKIFVYRNLGASGPVSTASFAAAQTLPALTSVPGGSPSLAELIVADIDSDGKPDVAASVSGASSGYYAVYRNTSTPGTISFANPLFFGYPYYSALLMTGGDLDGDGRIDLMGVTGTAPSNIYYCQNLSTPGNIDFGYGLIFSFSGIGSYSDIITADLNGDGKPEIIAPHYNGFPIQVFENNSTPGNIVMKAPFDYSPGTSLFDARITAGDLDGDGKIDLAWSAYISGFVFIGQNIFNGTTFDATSLSPEIKITNTLSSPQYLALGDVNADGRTDIVMSGYSDMGICENRSTVGSLNTNSFLPTVPLQGSQTGQAIAAKGTVIADLDGDNKPELAMGYTNGSVLTTDKGIFIFHNESFPAPVISNTSPLTGTLATAVAVNGTLLNNGSSSAQPTVRMGAIKATLSGAASNAVVNTSVPSGTMTGKFTLARNGLVASSAYPFTSKFNTNRVINATSFGPPIAFALGSSTRDQLQVTDFDDDGKADVWVVDASATAKIFRNTATAGQPITAASLTLNGTTYGSSTASLIVDVDGDGLNDVIGGQGLLQNASTSGNISLLSGPNGTPSSISGFNTAVAGDFNFDGKMDVITASGSSTFSVWENQSTRGNFVYY
ncbi:MAG TPA: FG-GAP-like repeat-containing protein, partial [Cyclobacteriaceae bacterium]|nr:FG-GAP-like repeat-containing protein [Cyclobacteriaceae bacterium]